MVGLGKLAADPDILVWADRMGLVFWDWFSGTGFLGLVFWDWFSGTGFLGLVPRVLTLTDVGCENEL